MVRGVFLGVLALVFSFGSSHALADEPIPTRAQLARVIDHTFLKTEAEGVSVDDQRLAVIKLVEEANRLGAYAVCVRSLWVALAKSEIVRLGGQLKIAAVIGFPDGDAMTTSEKIQELERARAAGADEFDMVIRVQKLKQGDLNAVYQDVLQVTQAAGGQPLKVIFENVYLSSNEKRLAYPLVLKAFTDSGTSGVRFLKTSTGFAKVAQGVAKGATFADVELMHESCGDQFVGIKAAGGVENFEQAAHYFELVGSPWLEKGISIDPNRFRIGSSSLLTSAAGGY